MSRAGPVDPSLYERDPLAVGMPDAGARRGRKTAPAADLSPEAIALAKRCGTYSLGDKPYVCGGCRDWVADIWWIGPQYPRTRLCLACATAAGLGPTPRGAGHG